VQWHRYSVEELRHLVTVVTNMTAVQTLTGSSDNACAIYCILNSFISSGLKSYTLNSSIYYIVGPIYE